MLLQGSAAALAALSYPLPLLRSIVALEKLASDDNDEKIAAIAALRRRRRPEAADVLKSAAEGEIEVDGKKVEIVVNNRVRARIAEALSVLKLLSPDNAERHAAATALTGGADPPCCPWCSRRETPNRTPAVKKLLELATAAMQLRSEDKEPRLAAIRALAGSTTRRCSSRLRRMPMKTSNARRKRPCARWTIVWSGANGFTFFAGVSLGSILLLAALGLAITYGLMGVINMAHGELIMIGAYTTYVVQGWFRGSALFDFYLVAAIPAAFVVSAAVGMLLERSVIRWLYGRPLETLLATWGISLVLIQAVRTIFGAQNVQVENPAFMSGGIQVMANVVPPWNRIFIILFAAGVLRGHVGTLLEDAPRPLHTGRAAEPLDGGLRRRADRAGRYVGLRTGFRHRRPRRLRALAGRQRRPGPRPGLHRRLVPRRRLRRGWPARRTVYAALVLGFANKLLESWSGAVLAKIAVLVFIISSSSDGRRDSSR